MKGIARKYSELDTIEVPEDVPEVGIKSGAVGTIVDIAPSGILAVEVVEESGATVEILDVDPEPAPRVIGRWHVGHSSLQDPASLSSGEPGEAGRYRYLEQSTSPTNARHVAGKVLREEDYLPVAV
ncbi:MAG: DUF4926 domain-containing protein [Rubrobacteraceae bacterium]|nr:DUF4926 domain-containing protein [Rubrobacteraceae bacterium]